VTVELIVAEDIATEGVALFLELAPRTVSLAGGSTPRPLFQRLAETPYPWDEVDVFFGDERCVPADDPDSDFKMANDALLSKVPARVHPMVGCDPDAYERELRAVFGDGLPRFDLMLLGVGPDGHTASLFPGDPALDVTDRPVVLVDHPDHRRMTLTLPVLSASKVAVFLISGQDKRAVLAKMLAGADIPAARVRAGRTVILADRAAVGA
jgi:6-phosphogluconolactonase